MHIRVKIWPDEANSFGLSSLVDAAPEPSLLTVLTGDSSSFILSHRDQVFSEWVNRKIQCHPATSSVQKWSQVMQNNVSSAGSFCCLIIVGLSVQSSLQGWGSAAESARLQDQRNQEESGRGRKCGGEREPQVGVRSVFVPLWHLKHWQSKDEEIHLEFHWITKKWRLLTSFMAALIRLCQWPLLLMCEHCLYQLL